MDKWYRVIAAGNFYQDMVGRYVGETERTIWLEFKMNDKLGGIQKVQMFKGQVEFDGEY